MIKAGFTISDLQIMIWLTTFYWNIIINCSDVDAINIIASIRNGLQ